MAARSARRPMLTGRPLLDSRADMALYLPRPQPESALRQAVEQGLNVALEGARGSGRSSMLRALLFAARTHEPDGPDVPAASHPAEPWHYLRAASARSAADLVRLVAAAVLGGDSGAPTPVPADDFAHDASLASAGASFGAAAGDDPLALVADLTRRLRTDPSQRHVVLLDDADPRLANQLFGVLRDELWGLPVQWVVAVTPDDAPVLLRPPADAFFERRVELPPLTAAEAEELIALRLGHPVQVPAGQEEWTPRDALDLARLAPAEWSASVQEKARRDVEVAKLGRPATMLVAAMEELGPVSPSDDRLLARTGWTSSRASQVFRQLLDVGLVAYREVRGDRPGRPARLYELRPLRG